MTINVSGALDSDNSLILTVTRPLAGSYIDGIYVESGSRTFKTLASPQQPEPAQLEQLVGGDRDKDVMLFISKRRLYASSDKEGRKADVISFDGSNWRIIKASNWSTFGHTLAYGVKI